MSGLPIRPVPDHDQIERVRPMLAGRRCVVVGSAPLSTPAALVDPDECVIAVNGSISSLHGPADLWLVNSKPNRTALHALMLTQGTGRAARHVVFLRGPKLATEPQTRKRLAQIGCQWQSWSVLDKPIKQHLEETICARVRPGVEAKPACSTGMFAVALALWCEAAAVRMTGFSWTPGYHYCRQGVTVRGHLGPDRRALKALHARYPGQLSGALAVAA